MFKTSCQVFLLTGFDLLEFQSYKPDRRKTCQELESLNIKPCISC